MKRVLVISLFAFLPALLFADAAKKVVVTYDKASSKVKMVALHKVKDVTTHYIDQIIIEVDGKEVKVISPKKQSSKENETLEVVIPNVKAGSEINIKTRCNEFGKKSGSVVVK